MFPNVLNEPPQHFKAGFPSEYSMGVDERWKEKFGVWLVRTPEDLVLHASGFYALIAVARISAARPITWVPNRSSSVRATAAAFD
jgi:hypothetical protein